jgi:hypothetical protein
MFKDLEEATVEGWVMWRRFGFWSRFFDFFGETNLDINVTIQNRGPKLAFEIGGSKNITDRELELNRWVHLAAVLGRGHARLYIDGELAMSLPTTGSFKALGNTSRNLLGGHPWKRPDNPVTDTDGSMEEVRVWNVARTQEQIRENLTKSLTGSEPGLVALWNFDDPANPGRDASPNHHDGKLVGDARAAIPSIAAAPVRRVAPFAGTSNQVLKLDGDRSFVELPPNVFNDLTEITVEGWVKWDRFQHFSRFFDFGRKGPAFLLAQRDVSPDLKFYVWPDRSGYVALSVREALKVGEWFWPQGARLFARAARRFTRPQILCLARSFWLCGVVDARSAERRRMAAYRCCGRPERVSPLPRRCYCRREFMGCAALCRWRNRRHWPEQAGHSSETDCERRAQLSGPFQLVG